MAQQRELEKIRRIYISSSVANFKEKLLKRIGFEEYHNIKDYNKPTLFVGLYHWRDWLRFCRHSGAKKVFWCGSDILALKKHKIWQWLIRTQKAKHYCENGVEFFELITMGIIPEIRPMIFDDPDKYPVSYKHSEHPKLFATYHKGREEEYGVRYHLDLDFLEGLPEEEFNEKIKEYQGAIRFNSFDGFAETLAKSILMGQYPVSYIAYPYIIPLNDGVDIIETLKLKHEPNIEGREYWLKVFEESLNEIVGNWSW